jgi:hypothetical protein
MNRISGLKHFGIYLLAVVIIGVGVWVAYRIHGPVKFGNSQVAFQGQITGIDWDSINVYGAYINDDDPTKSDFQHPVLIKITFNSNTKFVRTTWLQPTADDLKTYIKPPFLAQQGEIKKGGVIGDLRNQLGMLVVVKTKDSSGSKEITASEVDYSLPTSYTGYGFYGKFNKTTGTISATGVFSVQNSPAIFMSQGDRTVSLIMSPTVKITRTVIPPVDPAHPNAKQTIVPVQVTLAQLKSDIVNNPVISFGATASANVYGRASFSPSAIYYSIPPKNPIK